MFLLRVLIICLSFMSFAGISAGQDGPTRAITNVTGDLYRFQNNNHYSVFLVTPDGVIATDPIDAQAAQWLKEEIRKRFDQEVKYLVYSHDHWDHVSGGEVFDGAIVIAHATTKARIIGEKRATAVPHITYSESMSIELGGKLVNLMFLGKNHSDNSTVVFFPEERALFAVDFISVDRMPWGTLNDSYLPDWFESLRAVERLDFDTLLPGHGKVGSRDDVTEHRMYLEALHDAVLKAAREGLSLERIKSSIVFEQYRHFEMYDTVLQQNLKGMYRLIQANRIGN